MCNVEYCPILLMHFSLIIFYSLLKHVLDFGVDPITAVGEAAMNHGY